MWIVCKLHEMSRHFIWKINEKVQKKKKKMPFLGFELETHQILNERFTHYTTDDVMKFGQNYNSNWLDFSMHKPIIIIFP